MGEIEPLSGERWLIHSRKLAWFSPEMQVVLLVQFRCISCFYHGEMPVELVQTVGPLIERPLGVQSSGCVVFDHSNQRKRAASPSSPWLHR